MIIGGLVKKKIINAHGFSKQLSYHFLMLLKATFTNRIYKSVQNYTYTIIEGETTLEKTLGVVSLA